MATSSRGPSAQHGLAAFVLHSWDWSESSLIVDLFTRSQGRLVAAAKGAKKPTSNLRPVLLPFHPLTVWLSKPSADPEHEVRTLRAAEWGGGTGLAGSALMSAFYLNELIQKGLARQDPHPQLFDAYAEALGALADVATDEAAAVRAFELTLLRELGVLPALDLVTLTAEPVRASGGYTLQADAGVVEHRGGVKGESLVALQAALEHGSGPALRQACAPVAASLRSALRGLVHYHLGTKTLRTREVFLDVQRLAGSATAAAER